MQSIYLIDDRCAHCLPDCQTVIYDPKLTVVPFRRCDDSNLGISKFCNLDDQKLPEPRIWGQQVMDEYKQTVAPGDISIELFSYYLVNEAKLKVELLIKL